MTWTLRMLDAVRYRMDRGPYLSATEWTRLDRLYDYLTWRIER